MLVFFQESDAVSRAATWRIANRGLGAEDSHYIIDANARMKSLAVLPLRRLLLIGTDDGYIRVCS